MLNEFSCFAGIGRLSLEGKLHGSELSAKRVEDQPEAFEGRRAQEWIISRLADYYH
jgi:hypothetical protein